MMLNCVQVPAEDRVPLQQLQPPSNNQIQSSPNSHDVVRRTLPFHSSVQLFLSQVNIGVTQGPFVTKETLHELVVL